ncbi:MAG: NUDIX hydrolase [Chloroflexi bacterium]|nr:NUDIX hydrolase [Chloroflexota bacterium]
MRSQTEWVNWVQQLQAIAQNGLTYCENPYDIERYEQLRTLAAEIAAVYSHNDFVTIHDLFARAQDGYATPKIDVRGAVFREDALLLVRERSDNGRWTLPGGWADVGDPPSTAVTREVYEESGFETTAVKLLACYDRNLQGHPPHPNHMYKLIFHCQIIGGGPQTGHETAEVAFFRQAELPSTEELSISRTTATQLQRIFAHYHSPHLPTDFD